MKYCLKSLFVLTILLSTPIFAHELKSYQTPGSVVHEVNSEIVGQMYELAVSLPDSYAESKDRNYPVIYIMDGQWNFSIIQSIMGKLKYDGTVPEAIVVGVTWGGEGADANVLRARDFTPRAVPNLPNSGGAKKFITAMEKELIPYIEEHYRASKDSAITGSSLGGLIVMYTFLEQPRLFSKYVASAGAYRIMSEEYVSTKVAELTADKLLDNTRVFIACGLYDSCADSSTKLAVRLQAKNLSNLTVELMLAKDLGHAGVEPLSYAYGLQMVFARPVYIISDSVLKGLEGKYVGDDGFEVELTAEENGFLTRDGDGQELHWLAESDNRFYVVGSNVTMELLPDDQGKLVAHVNAQGNVFAFTKAE